MYNGIGLETARGSGTNGYVQRNMSFIRRHKDNVDYKSEEELRKLDSQLTRGPSREILDHERKRKVELKCMEMQELMEEQGYSEEEISRKVTVYRQMLIDNLETTASSSSRAVETDEAGRPIAKETHQIAEASQARNEQLRAAFGLSEFYKDGSSMDPQRKAKEQAAQALAAAQKTYHMVTDESSSSFSTSSLSPSPDRKKRHKEKRKPDISAESHIEDKDRRNRRSVERQAAEDDKEHKKRQETSSRGLEKKHRKHEKSRKDQQRRQGEELQEQESDDDRQRRMESRKRREDKDTSRSRQANTDRYKSSDIGPRRRRLSQSPVVDNKKLRSVDSETVDKNRHHKSSRQKDSTRSHKRLDRDELDSVD